MKKIFFSIFVMIFGLAFVTSALILQPAYAADGECHNRILSLPTWYRGLTVGDDSNCDLKKVVEEPENSDTEVTLGVFITTVVINITEILSQIVGYVSLFFVVYSGIRYITSVGSAAAVESAKKTLANALIGLVIAILATAIVNLIFGALG